MATKETAHAPKATSEVTPKVVVSEAPAPDAPKLSAQTLAEQEAGRAALKVHQDAAKARQSD